MSVYKGGKGARRRRRDERYYSAVGRQLLMHDRGYYKAGREVFGMPDWLCTPVPVEEFLRPEHRAVGVDNAGIDFRSWAGAR